MNLTDDFILWVGALIVAGLACHFILHRVTRTQRVERKRRRNYGRVVAKARRPVVMLSAKVGSR